MRTLFSLFRFLFWVALLPALPAAAQLSGKVTLFNSDWMFHKGDLPGGQPTGAAGSDWRTVDLPHDWSIEGPFSDEWASATGFLPGGIGWYQKEFRAPAAWKAQKVFVYFDGVYKNSTVWINGHLLGHRPNGFLAFQYELSPYLKFDGPNVITVKADHSQFADSRWYTGSGIYRNVYLLVKAPLHLAQWGVQFTTPEVSAQRAKANARVSVVNRTGKKTTATVTAKLVDAARRPVATATRPLTLPAGDSLVVNLPLAVANPRLWSVDDPHLYTLSVSVSAGGKVTDEWTEPVGIRYFRFDAREGFSLNGQPLKLKGVCLHDDAGALGVAVPEAVWRRRLQTLREGGSNSIRMAHNPHADYLYKLCDQMGFLVMDEAFDEWEEGKNKWIKGWNAGTPGKDGYHQHFKEWAATDVKDMILRNYNRPSIIMWSIGNEIDYPNDPYSHPVLSTGRNPQIYGRGYEASRPPASRLGELSAQLVQVVKAQDTTRPVTAALAGVVMSNTTSYPSNLDIVGYNYQEHRYAEDRAAYPDRVIYGSENGMQLSAWNAVDSNQSISAQYLWTGIDYLGEAGRWPERSNRAGLLDLAGFPKPEYYFRQSLWAEQPMIYIGSAPVPKSEDRGVWSHKQASPHWNWKQGDTVRVNCFTNCPEAELFLDGRSLGRRSMAAARNRILHWDLPYAPGMLTVKGYAANGKTVTDTLRTSGAAAALTVREEGTPSKDGLRHLAIRVVDGQGVPVYTAEDEITVSLEGGAKLLGLESGSSQSHEDYRSGKRKAFHGKLLAYVQLANGTKPVKVTLTAPGLQPAEVVLR
ncbi:sugar-binding domain-containing protein [Paraflavisolibacter sp. H34]|uniref:sugar-binding domain-containing protein n=1 Tax=Huijunlia imazamoxiresistens TaxID=3127457 RepID=UPI003017FE50